MTDEQKYIMERTDEEYEGGKSSRTYRKAGAETKAEVLELFKKLEEGETEPL